MRKGIVSESVYNVHWNLDCFKQPFDYSKFKSNVKKFWKLLKFYYKVIIQDYKK